MDYVLFTAFLVGGATILSGGVGLIFGRINNKFMDSLLLLAAGIMLSASVVNLILPSVEIGGVLTSIFGIFIGAFLVNSIDVFMPLIYFPIDRAENTKWRSSVLFVLAIAIHNLPEGIAAGVGLLTGESTDGLVLATAIALQNLPEGIIVTIAMLEARTRPIVAFLVSAFTGVVEIIGTFIGFCAVGISSALLPFALAIAGGAMLYVIVEEMIPDSKSEGVKVSSGYFFIGGFSLMLIIDSLI